MKYNPCTLLIFLSFAVPCLSVIRFRLFGGVIQNSRQPSTTSTRLLMSTRPTTRMIAPPQLSALQKRFYSAFEGKEGLKHFQIKPSRKQVQKQVQKHFLLKRLQQQLRLANENIEVSQQFIRDRAEKIREINSLMNTLDQNKDPYIADGLKRIMRTQECNLLETTGEKKMTENHLKDIEEVKKNLENSITQLQEAMFSD